MWQYTPKPKTCFHEVHGNDILLSKNCTIARRVQSTDNAVVFTSAPVKINEKISIQLLEVSEGLHAVLSVGFTNRDPSTLRHDLQKCSRSDLKKKPEFWIASLSKKLCVKDKVLFFYVSPTGNIHYGLDGVEKGHVERSVNTGVPMWALVDIWNVQTAISLDTYGKTKCGPVERAPPPKPEPNNSYIFTSKPLPLNQKLQLKFTHDSNLVLGVTSCDPATLHHADLPKDPDALLDRPEYWVVINDPTMIFQNEDKLSYTIADSGEMKIMKNDCLMIKKVHVDVSSKLWGYFLADVNRVEVTESGSTGVDAEPTKHDVDSVCVVCVERPREAALYPCGHLYMCLNCARKQWRESTGRSCPICRVVIEDVLRVYK